MMASDDIAGMVGFNVVHQRNALKAATLVSWNQAMHDRINLALSFVVNNHIQGALSAYSITYPKNTIQINEFKCFYIFKFIIIIHFINFLIFSKISIIFFFKTAALRGLH